MQSIRDDRAEKAKVVADHSSEHDQHSRSQCIELLNEVNRLDRVRPENEIEDRLRPADQNQERSQRMPPTGQCADHQPDLIGISQRCSFLKYAP